MKLRPFSRVARMSIPRTNEYMRSNEVFRWSNRIIWILIALGLIVYFLFNLDSVRVI